MKTCNCNAKLSIENHYPHCSHWDTYSSPWPTTPPTQPISTNLNKLSFDTGTRLATFGIWKSTDITHSGLHIFPMNTYISIQNFLVDLESDTRLDIDTIISVDSPALSTQFKYPNTCRFLAIVRVRP
jgi:hypothetical protein